MSIEIEKAIQSITILSRLPAPAITQLAAFTQIRQVRAGETIFCQGEPSPYCFGIVSGEVVIQRVLKDRSLAPKVLGIFGAGEVFGESSLFDDNPRSAMASAKKDGCLLAVRGSDFRRWIQHQPSLGNEILFDLLKYAIARLRHTTSLLDTPEEL